MCTYVHLRAVACTSVHKNKFFPNNCTNCTCRNPQLCALTSATSVFKFPVLPHSAFLCVLRASVVKVRSRQEPIVRNGNQWTVIVPNCRLSEIGRPKP